MATFFKIIYRNIFPNKMESTVVMDYCPRFAPGDEMVTFYLGQGIDHSEWERKIRLYPNHRIIETDPPSYEFTCHKKEESHYRDLLREEGARFRCTYWTEKKPTYRSSVKIKDMTVLMTGQPFTFTYPMEILHDINDPNSMTPISEVNFTRNCDCYYNFVNADLIINQQEVNPDIFTAEHPLRIYLCPYSLISIRRCNLSEPVKVTAYFVDSDTRKKFELDDEKFFYRSGDIIFK